MKHCRTCSCEPKLTTAKTVHYGSRATPADQLICTAELCGRYAVMAVLVDGVFQGHAYCQRRGHRAQVLDMANQQANSEVTQ